MEYITRNLNLQITLPETYILQQGESPDKFYFISSGSCWVFVKDVVEEEAFVRKIGVGDFFGEIALMNGGQRTATIQTENYSTIGSLNKEHFIGMKDKSPSIQHRLKMHMINYDDQWKLFIIKLIKNVDYFENVPEEVLKKIFYDLWQEYY